MKWLTGVGFAGQLIVDLVAIYYAYQIVRWLKAVHALLSAACL